MSTLACSQRAWPHADDSQGDDSQALLLADSDSRFIQSSDFFALFHSQRVLKYKCPNSTWNNVPKLILGTQTSKQSDENAEQVERQIILPPRLSPIKRDGSEEVQEVRVSTVTATQGASTADIPTSTPLSAETQTRNRDLEPKGRNKWFSLGLPEMRLSRPGAHKIIIQSQLSLNPCPFRINSLQKIIYYCYLPALDFNRIVTI